MRKYSLFALIAIVSFIAGLGVGRIPGGEGGKNSGSVPAKTTGIGPAAVAEAASNAAGKTEGTVPRESATNAEVKVAGTVPVAESEPPPKAVAGPSVCHYYGGCSISVDFDEVPDLAKARSAVSVSPLREGALGFSREGKRLTITGDFALRTPVTLRISKGFCGIEKDFTHEFRRKDLEPRVLFKSKGRYLPPAGVRTLVLESVNNGRVSAEIRRVEPSNLVQLLAREERAYSRYEWNSSIDDEETAELAGDAETVELACENRPNEKETLRLPVRMSSAEKSRGIYLVSVGGENCRPWERRHRVVCVSDLGISARSCGRDTAVWVTSLLTGKPVAEAWVEVYSKANIRIAEGRTDARGFATCLSEDPANAGQDPFAVTVISPEADDMSFIAFGGRNRLDEQPPEGNRDFYLSRGDLTAYLATERGIYRHGEKFFVHGLVRGADNTAPDPVDFRLELVKPTGNKVYSTVTLRTDEFGAFTCEDLCVPDDQPSGTWTIQAVARISGKDVGNFAHVIAGSDKDGKVDIQLGERELRIEEFAPPQIRVKVGIAADRHPTNAVFTVRGEHLFGAPAKFLACEGAIALEDAPFAPADWKGWTFGNEDLGLAPSFTRLGARTLDGEGATEFAFVPKGELGLPRAAVKVIAEGTVFELGGRPVTARSSEIVHYYPFYLGSELGSLLGKPDSGLPRVRLAAVKPDGSRVKDALKLVAKVDRVDTISTYCPGEGWGTWKCERVRSTAAENLPVVPAGEGEYEVALPLQDYSDYVLTVTDPESGASYAHAFYYGWSGDEKVRAAANLPTKVGMTPDKKVYRPGEVPKLVVKSPFAGWALLSVLRDEILLTRVLELTNATSVIELPEVDREWSPNVDVTISVVQSVAANEHHLAARAHGFATLAVQPPEEELAVELKAETGVASNGVFCVRVGLKSPGAERAFVTLVDEGINLLTNEPEEDPHGYFAQLRGGLHPGHDLFASVLPVDSEDLKASGIKTGGGADADMFGRVSPVPSRRFRPLSLWKREVVFDRSGNAACEFALPEFAGEVRVTAVAYAAGATGSRTERLKVRPKLVMQTDAPRFVAPGDRFESVMTLVRSDDSVTNVVRRETAPAEPGEMKLEFSADGEGEHHEDTIDLPVRPAVAWRETAGVMPLGEWEKVSNTFGKASVKIGRGLAAELAAAREWLADYPHGCLEQTSSMMFPLIGAKGRERYLEAGVRRVESMVRKNDFTMWPDCNCAPWDREVSLYAAHFLFEAYRGGVAANAVVKAKVTELLRRWAMSPEERESAYACHTLAIAGIPEKDRMYRLYDARDRLDLLSRARLARAFTAICDRRRAEKLLETGVTPNSVKEAAFALLAIAELDAKDARLRPLVAYLLENRDRAKLHWGTTDTNAHALLALGEYERRVPPDEAAEPLVAWRKLTLPKLDEVKPEANLLGVTRRFIDGEGKELDLAKIRRGELVFVEIAITSSVTRVYSDLVVEDLFPGGFEPVGSSIQKGGAWVMRSDLRDDRALVFSERFKLEAGEAVRCTYAVRAVSAGEFTLPGTSVEAMYEPAVRAVIAPGKVTVVP